ncbi:hypothetical protein GCM10009118_24170 [Wandonia haliotis]|uniref:Uncharacterized protein n=1 Tax=Wandonia haliotis TaxID=574963 RepID=A0ABN1MSU5_9FLAO
MKVHMQHLQIIRFVFWTPNGADSIKAPNGSTYEAGEGYESTYDGQLLVGEGLKTLIWDSSVDRVDESGNTGGYRQASEDDLTKFFGANGDDNSSDFFSSMKNIEIGFSIISYSFSVYKKINSTS